MARKIRIPDCRPLPARKNVFCADFAVSGGRYQRVCYSTTDKATAHERHGWLVDAWLATGRKSLPSPTAYPWKSAVVAPAFVDVRLIVARYIKQQRADARQTDGSLRDRYNLLAAMNVLRDALKTKNMLALWAGDVEAVARAMIRKKWAYATIRDRLRHVRQAIQQCVKQGVLPMAALAHLTLVAKVKKSTPGIARRRKVRPVADDVVDATRPHLNRHVCGIVDVLRWTGARPSEICSLRVCDLVRTGPVWTCVLDAHKMAHRETADGSERQRELFFGPRAQAALAPFLAGRRRLDAFIFDPRDAEAERRARLHAERKTSIGDGNTIGSNRKERPLVTIGERYTAGTLRRAIQRVCKAQTIDAWHPYQLRHSAATRIRREAGIEAAALALGHDDAALTAAVYAVADRGQALDVMARVG